MTKHSFRAGFGASPGRRRAARRAARRARRRRPAAGRLALRALGRRPRRPRSGDQAGRRFLALRQQHAGSAPIRSRPTAPPGASAPCSPRMSRRSCATSSRPPTAAPTRSAARSPPCMRAGWTRPASRRAAPPPLRPYLDRIAAARSRDDLIRLFATPGYPSPVGVGIIPDPADPTRYVAVAGQAGLGMPNRDYYLREGAAVRPLSRRLSHLCDRRCCGSPASPIRRPRPTRSSRSSGASPRRTGRPSAAATSPSLSIR